MKKTEMQPPSDRNRVIDLVLQKDEQVRWTYQQKSTTRKTLTLFLLCGLFWFALFACFVYWTHRENDLTPDMHRMLSVFIVWGVVTLAAAPFEALKNTLYVITNRRALSITVYRLRHKPVVISLPLCEQLVHRIKCRRDGSADYLMYEEKFRQHVQSLGFKRVSDTEGAEAALRAGGVSIPDAGKENKAAFRMNIQYSPGIKILLLALGLHLFLTLLPGVLRSCRADLYLKGERTNAAIIGVQRKTQKEGTKIKSTVTRYYPILEFYTQKGTRIRATGFTGDRQPTWQPWERVSVLYLPENPERVMRDNSKNRREALLFSGLFAAVFLWLIVALIRALSQWRRERKTPFYHIEPQPICPQSNT